jgi:hypothetical protein
MKLNPKKCVFRVSAGKLLGFIFSKQGIKIIPNKIKDIYKITRCSCLKEIQQLTNCVDVVGRFIGPLGEKVMPLYHFLEKTDTFAWNSEIDAKLAEVKWVLSYAQMHTPSKVQKLMLLHRHKNLTS